MTELLFNAFINLSMITGIILMLFVTVCVVKIMYTLIEEWIDDWREENESNINN